MRTMAQTRQQQKEHLIARRNESAPNASRPDFEREKFMQIVQRCYQARALRKQNVQISMHKAQQDKKMQWLTCPITAARGKYCRPKACSSILREGAPLEEGAERVCWAAWQCRRGLTMLPDCGRTCLDRERPKNGERRGGHCPRRTAGDVAI